MPTSEQQMLQGLLDRTDAAGRTVILKAACAYGIVWMCRNPACTEHNPRGEELCHGCGHNQHGRPLEDRQPGLYSVPNVLWERLREDIALHLQDQKSVPTPPHAVTFPYTTIGPQPWSLNELILHYGGTQQPYTTDLDGTEIEELLTEIAHEAVPGYLEDLRITLPR
ncbi:hypothetical protein QMK19_39080 [Streptomyces sp. H10-C2]|uniref:hypothetical protein n=1 Tax=unclassified Streptomyces TaxID=2593676 RepID=UPI0024B931F4|nr:MULTISPECIES: hypothetical protein [unclassified Streptomyces]MDJ0347212.1 hypothetical protein [Streptomyces sp. PH10-H1]MDJ0375440.1 hypothetical protein [Streptomyces sp. H10-C2]